jgi:hypothetical protein
VEKCFTWQLKELGLDDLVDTYHLGFDQTILGHVVDELHHQVTATINIHITDGL